MYWCRLKLLIVTASAGCLLTGSLACKPAETGGSTTYFDIKGYFTADTARLKKLNPFVLKTVKHNGVTETKKVKIENWGQELDSFIGGDINRPAWKNSYSIATGDSLLLYKAKTPELKVREIIIKKENDKVKWMVIYIKTENMLYKDVEKLSYYPDSLYLIEKDQHVKLMGNNHYRIQGIIQK